MTDSQRTFQQTRSFGLAAKPKTVPGHLLIGNALVVDLPSLGSIRSAGTREYQWPTLCSWQKIARFGDKSQRRNATAERFASWWWWWLTVFGGSFCMIDQIRFQVLMFILACIVCGCSLCLMELSTCRGLISLTLISALAHRELFTRSVCCFWANNYILSTTWGFVCFLFKNIFTSSNIFKIFGPRSMIFCTKKIFYFCKITRIPLWTDCNSNLILCDIAVNTEQWTCYY